MCSAYILPEQGGAISSRKCRIRHAASRRVRAERQECPTGAAGRSACLMKNILRRTVSPLLYSPHSERNSCGQVTYFATTSILAILLNDGGAPSHPGSVLKYLVVAQKKARPWAGQ